MNKKKVCIVLIILVFITMGVLISIILLKTDKKEIYPKEPSFGRLTYAGMKDGLYYKDANLMYFDKATGESVVLCNKPNCQHNTTDCNSYIGEHINKLMVYGDSLYVCFFNVRIIETEDPMILESEHTYGLIKVSLDGQRKEVLFEKTQAGYGGITTIEGIDGKIFYTYYAPDPDDYMKQDYTMHNAYFACFDLRNGSNEIIESWTGVNAGIDILETDSSDTLYLKLSYFTDENVTLENIDEISKEKLFSYTIDNSEFNDCYTNAEDIYKVLWISENCMYYRKHSSIENIVYANKGENPKFAIDMIDGTGACFYPYLVISKDDNDRIIIDLEKKKLYVPRDINEKIPGVLDYNYNNNILYTDLSCYDNIPDGTVLTYNPVSIYSTDMETYLNKYYVVYEKDNYQGNMVLGEEWLNEFIAE